jgi:hypothetical protein
VIVMAGVPSIMQAMLDEVAPNLKTGRLHDLGNRARGCARRRHRHAARRDRHGESRSRDKTCVLAARIQVLLRCHRQSVDPRHRRRANRSPADDQVVKAAANSNIWFSKRLLPLSIISRTHSVLVRGCDNRASTAIENSVTMVFFELSCWFHAAANECQAIRDLVVRRGEITPGPLPRTLISGVP